MTEHWTNEANPLGPPASPPGTPLTAENLEAVETRVKAYADQAKAAAVTIAETWVAQNFLLKTLLTTKGDLAARSATAETRVAVGTNGQVLTADSAQSSGLLWATPGAFTIADGTITSPKIKNWSAPVTTALPGSPGEGEICFFQSASMATAGVVWQLRFRAQPSFFKWEFIGGAPLYLKVDADETVSSSTYANAATVGPDITLPLGGDYDVRFGVRGYGPSLGIAAAAAVCVGTGTTPITSTVQVQPTMGDLETGARADRLIGRSANDVLRLKYISPAGTAHFMARWMAVTPVRLG